MAVFAILIEGNNGIHGQAWLPRNISIVCPFGIGKGCFFDKRYEIRSVNSTNNSSSLDDPRPILQLNQEIEVEVEVSDTSLQKHYLRIKVQAGIHYTNSSSKGESCTQYTIMSSMEPFSIGCDIFAYIGGFYIVTNSRTNINNNYISACVSVCKGQGWSWLDTNYSCSGIGCCQTTFPSDLSNIVLQVGHISIWPKGRNWTANQSTFLLIPENNFSEFRQLGIWLSNKTNKFFYHTVTNWKISDSSCLEAAKRGDYARGDNTRCDHSTGRGTGYRCSCDLGYSSNVAVAKV